MAGNPPDARAIPRRTSRGADGGRVNPNCPPERVLLAFHQGTLPADELDSVADHLETCPRCEAAAERLDRSVDRVLAVVRKRVQAGSWSGTKSGRSRVKWDGVDDADPATWPHPPGYEVVGPLGRGGMGVVYRARQVRLGRLVALKELRTDDPREVARARTEAEAMARLQHPGIVQIHEVVEHAGRVYLALELVEGGSLRDRLDGKPHPPRDVAGLVEALARAAHYAHGHKILHRDLKPANVLLPDPAGPAAGFGPPKITDFGVAKRLTGSQGETCDGDVLGTPAYMAPEQAAGARGIGPPADVYSLGVVLYELLTGRVPLQGLTTYDTLVLVRTQDPVPPRRLQPKVPRDLETVCLKCLEKDPGRRYPTAAELADDLRRFQNGESIRARPTPAWERAWKWARRQPEIALLSAAVVLVTVLGVASVAWQWRRAEGKAGAEAAARRRAEAAEEEARASLYYGLVAQARLEGRLNHADRADQLLARCEPDRRGWEWQYLRGVTLGAMLALKSDDRPLVPGVAFSPDGRLLAAAGWNPYRGDDPLWGSRVDVWDARDGRLVRTLAAPAQLCRVAFSPDGRLLAAASPSGEARLWDAATGAEVRSWAAGGSVTFTPDGTFLAAGGPDGVSFWAVATGALARRLPAPKGRVTVSPDGRVIAVSRLEGVDFLAAADGRPAGRVAYGPEETAYERALFFAPDGPDLAFSPDGKRVITGTNPPKVWDVATGRPVHDLGGHTGAVPGVAFGPDGRLAATAGTDGLVRVWDAGSGRLRAVYRGHAGWVGCLTFHPAGWCLASGAHHPGDVMVWDLTRDPEYVSLAGHLPAALAFDAGGAVRVLTELGRLQTRDPDTGASRQGAMTDLTPDWATPARLADFSGDGRRAATVCRDRRVVKVWDTDSGREVAALSGLAAPAWQVVLDRTGGRAAAAGFTKDKTTGRYTADVRVWDADSGHELAAFRPDPEPGPVARIAVALTPDGDRVAFCAATPGDESATRVLVCEAAGGRPLLSLPAPRVVWTLAFGPDGRTLAAGGADGRVVVWDTATGEPVMDQTQDRGVFRLAFHPDGRRLAAVDREQARVWDVRAGQEVLGLRGAPPRLSDGGFNPTVAWSPDGRRLAVGVWTSDVAVWDTADPDPADRRRRAEARAFGWHLDEATAAAADRQAGAVAFHLGRIRAADPPDTRTRVRRAHLLDLTGERAAAAADYDRVYDAGGSDDLVYYLDYARILARRSDAGRYRRVCGEFVRAQRMSDLWPLVRVCVLVPDSGRDPADVVDMATKSIACDPRNPIRRRDLALALYRAGRYPEAVRAAEEAAAGDPGAAPHVWPVLAMAESRLGHAVAARRWLDQAAAEYALRAARTEEFVDDHADAFSILYEEAARLVGGAR